MRVFTYTCDVGSLEAVRELGREIKINTPDRHLSYLFNVAGMSLFLLFLFVSSLVTRNAAVPCL